MTTPAPQYVGKYVLLGQGSSTYGTTAGQVIVVIEHKVSASGVSGNLTTVAVVRDMDAAKAIAAAAQAAGDATIVPELGRSADKTLTDLTNRALGALMGAGKWKDMFDSATPVLKPDAGGGGPSPPSAADLMGKSFPANLPVIVSGSIRMVDGTWTVQSRAAGGGLMLTAAVGGVSYCTLRSSYIPMCVSSQRRFP